MPPGHIAPSVVCVSVISTEKCLLTCVALRLRVVLTRRWNEMEDVVDDTTVIIAFLKYPQL